MQLPFIWVDDRLGQTSTWHGPVIYHPLLPSSYLLGVLLPAQAADCTAADSKLFQDCSGLEGAFPLAHATDVCRIGTVA